MEDLEKNPKAGIKKNTDINHMLGHYMTKETD